MTTEAPQRVLVALFATTLENHPTAVLGGQSLKDSSWSPLVSSQGVVSPPLPNGCGRELHGPHLYRDQRDSICCTS